jgi:hypothetical protein
MMRWHGNALEKFDAVAVALRLRRQQRRGSDRCGCEAVAAAVGRAKRAS